MIHETHCVHEWVGSLFWRHACPLHIGKCPPSKCQVRASNHLFQSSYPPSLSPDRTMAWHTQLRRRFVNHYGGKQLAASSRTVRKNTLQIAEDIPQDKYDFRPAPGTRSIAELLTHIAVSQSFQEEV